MWKNLKKECPLNLWVKEHTQTDTHTLIEWHDIFPGEMNYHVKTLDLPNTSINLTQLQQ